MYTESEHNQYKLLKGKKKTLEPDYHNNFSKCFQIQHVIFTWWTIGSTLTSARQISCPYHILPLSQCRGLITTMEKNEANLSGSRNLRFSCCRWSAPHFVLSGTISIINDSLVKSILLRRFLNASSGLVTI